MFQDLTDALEEAEHAMFEEINFSNGVLTIDMADGRSYVLNRQTPNLQVWLSSPISGPQRFEYELDSELWLQIRSKDELIELLNSEFNEHFVQEGQPQIDIKL